MGAAMLGHHDTSATLAVKELEAARGFYEGVLGFGSRGDVPDGVLYGARVALRPRG
ncbi:MAG: hypothetical protein ACJ711_15025 [Ornithinibacter sp.]